MVHGTGTFGTRFWLVKSWYEGGTEHISKNQFSVKEIKKFTGLIYIHTWQGNDYPFRFLLCQPFVN